MVLLDILGVLAGLRHFYLLMQMAAAEHMYISLLLAIQQERAVQLAHPALVKVEIMDTMGKIQQSLNLMTA